MPKHALEVIVFTAGAVVMVFELVGSRVMAPYFGGSLIVWTALIGVILGSLSAGYALGGFLADRKSSLKILSLILVAAALSITVMAAFKAVFLRFLESAVTDIRLGSFLAAVVLFAPASIFLGMVSPYAVRLKIKSIESAGRLVGNLYALSTIGSIAGTFLAGFWLIPFFGTTKLLYALAASLIILSGLASFSNLFRTKIILLLVMVAMGAGSHYYGWLARAAGYVDKDTAYNRIIISQGTDNETGRPVKYLTTDPHGIQGAMFLDDPVSLVFTYTKLYRLAGHFSPDPENALLVGGGAYSWAKYFLAAHPNSRLDAVEIDPGMTEAAREYFSLADNPRLNIIHADGRAFLNKNEKKYDHIYLDAFNAALSIPFQLTTKEALTRVKNTLNDDGVLMANIVSAFEGEESDFFRAELATFRAIFPRVYVFRVKSKTDPAVRQNIMLVALKGDQTPIFTSEDAELNEYLGQRYEVEPNLNLPVLTDDYAPVDYYALKFLF